MEKEIVLEYIDTNNQVANMFTKPLEPLCLKELNCKIDLN